MDRKQCGSHSEDTHQKGAQIEEATMFCFEKTTLFQAVSTECLPWEATLRKVREKATVEWLNGEVQKLAQELGGLFNYLEVRASST